MCCRFSDFKFCYFFFWRISWKIYGVGSRIYPTEGGNLTVVFLCFPLILSAFISSLVFPSMWLCFFRQCDCVFLTWFCQSFLKLTHLIKQPINCCVLQSTERFQPPLLASIELVVDLDRLVFLKESLLLFWSFILFFCVVQWHSKCVKIVSFQLILVLMSCLILNPCICLHCTVLYVQVLWVLTIKFTIKPRYLAIVAFLFSTFFQVHFYLFFQFPGLTFHLKLSW